MKFKSNSREVLASFPVELRVKHTYNPYSDQPPLERALGVYWDAQSDTFKFKAVPACKPSSSEEYFLLLVPCLICQHSFHPLCSHPEFCNNNFGVTSSLGTKNSRNRISQWQKQLDELPHVIMIDITRCYKIPFLGTPETVQLNNFSDASKLGRLGRSDTLFLCYGEKS